MREPFRWISVFLSVILFQANRNRLPFAIKISTKKRTLKKNKLFDIVQWSKPGIFFYVSVIYVFTVYIQSNPSQSTNQRLLPVSNDRLTRL